MAAFPNIWRKAAARAAGADDGFPANLLKTLDIPFLARLVLNVLHQAGLSRRFADGV